MWIWMAVSLSAAEPLADEALCEQRDLDACERLAAALARDPVRLGSVEVTALAWTLHAEALVRQAAGDLPRAAALHERLIPLLGRVDPLAAGEMFNDAGTVHHASKDYARAIELYRVAVPLSVADPVQEAAVLVNLATALQESGAYASAVAPLERAVALREAALGPDAPPVGVALRSLARALRSAGDTERAYPWAQRAYEHAERAGAAEARVSALELLGTLEVARGDYTAAFEHLDEVVAFREAADDRRALASGLQERGRLLERMGLYDRALDDLGRAVTLREAELGPDDGATLMALTYVGMLLTKVGDYDGAAVALERALVGREAALGSDHPNVGQTLTSLGTLYLHSGSPERALSMHQRAYAIFEARLGPGHRQTAAAMNNLALTHQELGQREAAAELLLRACDAVAAAQGADHPDTATTLNNLSVLYREMGRTDEAVALGERALAIRRNALGEDHVDVAESLHNLARLHQDLGRLDEALAGYERAASVLETTFGLAHPATARALSYLARAHAAAGDDERALASFGRALDVEELVLQRNLWRGTPQERDRFLAEVRHTADAAWSAHLRDHPSDAAFASLAFETLLRRKGRLVDVEGDIVRAARAAGDPVLAQRIQDLDRAQGALGAHLRAVPDDPTHRSAWRDRRELLEADVDSLWRALSADSAEHRTASMQVRMDDLVRHLPESTALVEWAVWSPSASADGAAPTEPARLAVYVLTREGLVAWADLGPETEIGALVDDFRAAILERGDGRTAGRALCARVLDPVSEALASSRLLLSPDGPLHLAPLAALVTADSRYLAETHRISLLTSGRDLLRFDEGATARSEPVVISSVDFGAATAASSHRWEPLPGTVVEGRAVSGTLRGARHLTGPAASEAALKALGGPRVLHVATHGFLAGQPAGVADGRGLSLSRPEGPAPRSTHPLAQSGLVLAGANLPGAGVDDGVLTAGEVVQLDLRGTRLVVLSACDTGLGEVRNGDGVQGLRRALVIAGARTQVVSLWKVDDRATAWLMTRFYRRAARGVPLGSAMADAQARMARARDWSSPFYWAAFTLSGDAAGTLTP